MLNSEAIYGTETDANMKHFISSRRFWVGAIAGYGLAIIVAVLVGLL